MADSKFNKLNLNDDPLLNQKFFDEIIEWAKDPLNAPSNQNKYLYGDGVTYYQELCKILKYVQFLKDYIEKNIGTREYVDEQIQILNAQLMELITALDNKEASDIQGLQEQITSIQSSVGTIAENLQGLTAQYLQTKEDVASLESEVGPIAENLQGLTEQYLQTKEDVVNLETEVNKKLENVNLTGTGFTIKSQSIVDGVKHIELEVSGTGGVTSITAGNGLTGGTITSEGIIAIDENIVATQEQITQLEDKIKEIELFKFPNMVIVGTPTIQQGQVSDFSMTDFLEFPFLVDFRNQPFEINFAINTDSDVTNQQNILDSEYGLAFAIRNARFVMALSTNGTSWATEQVGTHIVQPTTSYRIKITWNRLTYKVKYSLDGGVSYIDDISFNQVATPYPKLMYIGVGKLANNFFKGIINLNHANVYVNDNLVWQGMDDVGLASRLSIDMANIDTAGIQKVKDIVSEDFQEKLVSGSNIKTINDESILGNGNVEVQPTLVSGTNIKTINSTSLLGSGNITISSAYGIDFSNILGSISGGSDNSITATSDGVALIKIQGYSGDFPARLYIDGEQCLISNGELYYFALPVSNGTTLRYTQWSNAQRCNIKLYGTK